MEFYVPKAEVIFEEEIKKSRFITYLRRTEGIAQAKQFWQEMKTLHPQARHWCWAAVAGTPNDGQQYGFSDDGEPSGTAGKPMLNYLIGSGLGEISAVVVRYYGGIQLGTGGLVKAYGGGVQQALQRVERERKVLREAYRLQCEYEQFSHVQNLIQAFDIELTHSDFAENVTLQLAINPSDFTPFLHALTQRFSGGLALERCEA